MQRQQQLFCPLNFGSSYWHSYQSSRVSGRNDDGGRTLLFRSLSARCLAPAPRLRARLASPICLRTVVRPVLSGWEPSKRRWDRRSQQGRNPCLTNLFRRTDQPRSPRWLNRAAWSERPWPAPITVRAYIREPVSIAATMALWAWASTAEVYAIEVLVTGTCASIMAAGIDAHYIAAAIVIGTSMTNVGMILDNV